MDEKRKTELFGKIKKEARSLIAALVAATGSQQNAMFLFLNISIANNLKGCYLDDSRHVTSYRIIGLSKSESGDSINVYISEKSYHAWGGHSGASADLDSYSNYHVDIYKKDEIGQWALFQTESVERLPRGLLWSI